MSNFGKPVATKPLKFYLGILSNLVFVGPNAAEERCTAYEVLFTFLSDIAFRQELRKNRSGHGDNHSG